MIGIDGWWLTRVLHIDPIAPIDPVVPVDPVVPIASGSTGSAGSAGSTVSAGIEDEKHLSAPSVPMLLFEGH